jgi:galactokinase
MAKGDMIRLGQVLNASQRSLGDNYNVSTPELDMLCDLLTATPGIYGARLAGGGFGGGILALMARHALEEALPDALASFESQSGLATEWSEAVPGEGAMVAFPGSEPELVREWLP